MCVCVCIRMVNWNQQLYIKHLLHSTFPIKDEKFKRDVCLSALIQHFSS